VNKTVGIAFPVSSYFVNRLVCRDCRGSCTPVDPPSFPPCNTCSDVISLWSNTCPTGCFPWIQSSQICRRMACRSGLIPPHVTFSPSSASLRQTPIFSTPIPLDPHSYLCFREWISNSAHFCVLALPHICHSHRFFTADRPASISLGFQGLHCLYASLALFIPFPLFFALHSVAYRS
jgi:hypothetical protein